MKKNLLSAFVFTSAICLFTSYISSAQPISTIAGNGAAGFSGDGNPATSAMINYPLGVAVDGSGNVYIGDYSNQRIRKVDVSGNISTFAGTGTQGFNGDGQPATNAMLNNAVGVAVDAAGNVYIADNGNQRIRKVDGAGIITTFAGTGTNGFSGDGGAATSAMLSYPKGVAVDGAGNVYISEEGNNRIRKVDAASGIITTIAGTGTAGFSGDGGAATSAQISSPSGVGVDGSGNVYIADYGNSKIRKVNTSGIISSIAAGYSGQGVTADGIGNVYIASSSNHRIWKVDAATGNVSAYAGNGSGTFGGDGGAAQSASLFNPWASAVDAAGNLFIADQSNQRIRKVGTCSVTVTISNVINVSCFGGNNGSATANPSANAIAPVTYSWSTSPSQSSATATGLTAGNYIVNITDAVGCTATANVTITQPATALSANITSSTPIPCNGMCNGSATAAGTGGVSPYNYSWGTTPPQTTQTATGFCTGGYIVTVTDANSCTETAIITFTQPAALSISTSGNTTICAGQTVNISGAESGGTSPFNYVWADGAGSYTGASITVSPTVTTTYTLTVTDANSCTAQALVVVTVNPLPTISISGAGLICSGSSATLTAAGGNTYAWNTGQTVNPIVVSPTSNTSYFVVGTDGNGCSSNATATVTVNQTPTVTAGSNSPVCSGGTLSLNASTLAGATYTWNGPNSFSSSSQNPTIASVTTAGAGTYSITLAFNGCTSAVATTSVTVNQIPSAPTASSNSPVNTGNTLSLTASNISGATYNWSNGPFSSSLQNPTITNVTTANAGCYSVTATVNGCTSSAATTCVTVVTLSITTSTTSVSCNGGNDGAALVVSVTGGVSPYTYSWSTTPAQTTQAIFNLVAGTYTVTVTDAIGSSATATVNITQPSPVTVFTNPTNVSCFGGNNGIANAIAGGGTSPYIYSWNSFPIQTTATAANLSAGNYMVTVTDANGCTGTNTVAITQPSALTVSMTIVNSNCGSNNGSATANVTGGTNPYTYLWLPIVPTNVPAGNYSVSVTDSKGCTVNSIATIGIIPSNFNLAFSGTPQNGPSPLNVTFSNTTPSMSSYNFTWYWGDGNNVSNNNATVFYTYNFAGTYNVALIATSIANGCTDTLVKAPYINVTGAGCTHNATVTPSGPINACLGDTVILTANTNAISPFTYQWNIGAVAISGANNSTLAVTQGGYYSVTIIKNNCPVTSSAVQVNFTTLPQQPTITSAGNIVPCLGGSVTLTSSTVSGVTYSWNTSPVQSTQSIIVNSSGNYIVTVTNGAGCSTASAPFTVNASLAQVPICLVTVDSISLNNIIAWEKQPNQPIDSFIVYREISTNNYKQIGAVLYDSLSLFMDTVRTKYFPNTGDPDAGTYRYKIALRDTCGNYSPLSPYHNTIYVVNNSGTFFWPQLYTIENSGNPVTTYDLFRDDNSTGVWNVINSVAGTQQIVTDPAYATYTATASWRVETQWGISCTATIKNPQTMATNLNSSRSNIYKVNNPTSVNEAENNFYVNVFPNPSNGIFTLDLRNNNSGSAIIKVFNVLGEEVKQINCVGCNSKTTIDLSKQAKGVYYIKVSTNDKVTTKKIIIE